MLSIGEMQEDPQALAREITESGVMFNEERAINALDELVRAEHDE